MQLNVIYDENSLFGNSNNIDSLALNQIVITNKTSEIYNLKKGSSVYSVDGHNLLINEYVIKSVINDFYPFTNFNNTNSNGFLLFGFNPLEEESTQNKEYINTSFEDPSLDLIQSNIILIDFYEKEILIAPATITMINYLVLKILFVIVILGFGYYFLIIDVKDHLIRLSNQGSIVGYLKLLKHRFILFFFSNLMVLFIFFSIIYKLFSLSFNFTLVLATLTLIFTTTLINKIRILSK
jgi:hypothetical protein